MYFGSLYCKQHGSKKDCRLMFASMFIAFLNAFEYLHHTCRSNTWVNDFRIIPEFRIFEADFPQKVSLKMLNSADNDSFPDSVSVNLKVFDQ